MSGPQILVGMEAQWAPAPAQPFSGANEKTFLHKIGVDQWEGVDEKQQYMTKERGHEAK